MIHTTMHFHGESSRAYHMLCSYERPLLPQLRRSTITIPRRAGVYDATIGMVYEETPITVHCLVKRAPDETLRETVRRAAYWLSGKGALSFDSEPGRYYFGHVSEPTEVVIRTNHATFDVVFQCYPFAQGDTITVPIASGENAIAYRGTVPAGAHIVLRNDNDFAVGNITLAARIKRR